MKFVNKPSKGFWVILLYVYTRIDEMCKISHNISKAGICLWVVLLYRSLTYHSKKILILRTIKLIVVSVICPV